MSTKHTPGPWHVAKKTTSMPNLGVYCADGKLLATVQRSGSVLSAERRAKDAALMAAGPDLLDALLGVLRVADRATVEFDVARSAILKATGVAQ